MDNWPDGFVNPQYFTEDMYVFVATSELHAVWCRVKTAAGNSAFVENKDAGVERWVGLKDVAVKRNDPTSGECKDALQPWT